jgi:hypothetical protein
LPFEPLGTPINQWNDSIGVDVAFIVYIYHVGKQGVDPSSSFDRVQSCNNDIELGIEIFLLVLDLAKVPEASYSQCIVMNHTESH